MARAEVSPVRIEELSSLQRRAQETVGAQLVSSGCGKLEIAVPCDRQAPLVDSLRHLGSRTGSAPRKSGNPALPVTFRMHQADPMMTDGTRCATRRGRATEPSWLSPPRDPAMAPANRTSAPRRDVTVRCQAFDEMEAPCDDRSP